MHQTRYENYRPIDNDSDNTSRSDLGSIFDISNNKANMASDIDVDQSFKEVDDNANDDDDIFDDKVQHPPKYYLAATANLNVGRLRQKCYSPKTQSRLD